MENFFARCTDEIFWADRERVQVLILYQEAECLWNSRNVDYKSQSKKKTGNDTWIPARPVRAVYTGSVYGP